MKKTWVQLHNMVEQKYGKSNPSSGFPKISTITGNVKVINTWELNDRNILLGIHFNNDNNYSLELFLERKEKQSKSTTTAHTPEKQETKDFMLFEDFKLGESTEAVYNKIRKSKTISFTPEHNPKSEDEQVKKMFTQTSLEGRLSLVVFAFDNNYNLNQISIILHPRNTGEYDTETQKDWKSIRKILIEKYKTPAESEGFPHFFKNRAGKLTMTDIWRHNGKEIVLNIGTSQKLEFFPVITCSKATTNTNKQVKSKRPPLSAEEKEHIYACMRNIKQIAMALNSYALDHNDKFPENLQQLVAGKYLIKKTLVCPARAEKKGDSYIYFSGFMIGESDEYGHANTPVAFDMPGNHRGYILVAMHNGNLETFQTNARTATQVIDMLNKKKKYSQAHLKVLYKKAAEADKKYGLK